VPAGAQATLLGPITPTITQFGTGITLDSGPDGIVAGPDGKLYFAESGLGKIGIISTTGHVTEVGLPGGSPSPQDLAVANGKVWFTDPPQSAIGSITVGATHTVNEYSHGMPSGARPHDITLGPDGKLWFTDTMNNQVDELDPAHPAAGVTTHPSTALTGAEPFGITSGPGNKLWFTERSGNAIATLNPRNPNVVPTTFSTGIAPASKPRGIATGPDGNVWFTEQAGDQIGRITPGGTVTEFPLPTATSTPAGIVAGPDDALWFVENNGGTTEPSCLGGNGRSGAVGRITPGGVITEYPLTDEVSRHTGDQGCTGPFYLTVGPDGNIWFTEILDARVGRITTPPVAGTGTASSVSGDSALVRGTVDPHAQLTTYRIQYGTTLAYGHSTQGFSAGSGRPVRVSIPLAGLGPHTRYHYRLVAANQTGTDAGADATFTTDARSNAGPSLATGPAVQVHVHTAKVIGAIASDHHLVSYWLEYGRTRQYGLKTRISTIRAAGIVFVRVALTNMNAGRRYHYRLVGRTASGTTLGSDATLKTSTG
jgi:streptogramin lyase